MNISANCVKTTRLEFDMKFFQQTSNADQIGIVRRKGFKKVVDLVATLVRYHSYFQQTWHAKKPTKAIKTIHLDSSTLIANAHQPNAYTPGIQRGEFSKQFIPFSPSCSNWGSSARVSPGGSPNSTYLYI